MTTNNKLCTILLIRNAASGDFGGAETYQVSIASVLSANGYNPIIVSRSRKLLAYATDHSVATRKGWWWSQQNWNGYRIILTPVYVAWQIILTLWYMRLIISSKASALHIQSKDDFIAGTIAGKLLRKKVIWTDHMDLRYIFQNINMPLRNPVGKIVYWAAHFIDHLILISQNEYNLVTGHFKSDDSLKNKISIINNGVIDQFNRFNTIHRATASFSFCLASRIVRNKGVGDAIESYIEFKKNTSINKPTVLNIYGDGPDMQKFQALAKGHDDIIFHGHQVNAIEKIAQSDVFMLPSYQEGFSIALLEATMLGKAIIASSVDSNPEIIHNRKTGLLVPARNTKRLADAMSALATDNHLKESLEHNARKSFEDNFNLEVIVREKIIKLYVD